ncbi:MAG: bifunctional 4-hydroxy-2-oxoglutarate aldolase/2-dehydro-3-deoxy-phosphogluconate aldolase [Kangiellaceae bacterium]|jgi:2-dehydro-3-deoxyphosphogluconate aldolase/(4S)-4-hydroxy-2-oxoglutarate aldolase|nr:bifunctional 4-hydroxy-2-oxoglutarate aldolase/2-dehydro-3-deoxy-phosphogluconate aldolase [Kangiellaceae bacterium]
MSILSNIKVIPLLTVDDPSTAVELAELLVSNRFPIVEVTLRTPNALSVIQAIVKKVPQINVAAGTVISPVQLQQVADAGCKMIVCPGISRDLIEQTQMLKLNSLMGVSSASELILGLEYKLSTFKFFPAEASGGRAWLQAMKGPFPDISFCPTGGINQSNYQQYLELSNVLAVGGSWMLPQDDINQRDWTTIDARLKLIQQQVGL